MRSRVKRLAERLLLGSGVPALGRRSGRSGAVILGYHNVVPDGDGRLGDSSLHLPLGRFRAQLDLLQEHFQVVPLATALGVRERRERPLAAVTFDDGYRGCLTLGLPELVSRGLPATVFVPPGLLGSEGFWWDRVADPEAGTVPPALRDHALRGLGGRQEAILRHAREAGHPLIALPELYVAGSEEEVEAAGRLPGIALGSHTWTHVSLAAVAGGELEAELARPREWLEARGFRDGVLSYPYGAWSEDAVQAARGAGYDGGLLTGGGRASARRLRESPFGVPRINIPRGMTPEGFLLRASGTWPA